MVRFRPRDPGPALRSDPGYKCLAPLGLQIGASEPNDTERDLISLAESLVILVAWWFKESGPDILHEGAEPAKEVVAVKDWPLVKRSPPGNEKGSPPVMGILFHIREKQIP